MTGDEAGRGAAQPAERRFERNESTCCVRDKASQANKLSYKAAHAKLEIKHVTTHVASRRGSNNDNEPATRRHRGSSS